MVDSWAEGTANRGTWLGAEWAAGQLAKRKATILVALSAACILLSGPFALVPLFWSVSYRRAVKAGSSNARRLGRVAKVTLAISAFAGIALAPAAACAVMTSMKGA